MTQIVLKSGNARAVIFPERGALVASLKLTSAKHAASELLWLPPGFDPGSSAWPGGGLPFLFPFAGRVWHKGELYKYGIKDAVYSMPLHGFSWATSWSVKAVSETQATLELQSNDTTLGLYPFHFKITMTITLEPSSLKSEITILHIKPHSAENAEMPVAIGWHPYFALGSSSQTLSIPAETVIAVTPQGGAGKPMPASEFLGDAPWTLPKKELQSLILSNLRANEPVSLTSAAGSELRLTSGPPEVMKHVVTWTNEPTEFHCVEPWMSLPDAVSMPSGCQWLKAGSSLQAWLKITV